MTRESTTGNRDIFASPKGRSEPSLALLAERFEAVARVRNDAIAITDGQRRMSYGELLLRADALAGELEARGIESSVTSWVSRFRVRRNLLSRWLESCAPAQPTFRST